MAVDDPGEEAPFETGNPYQDWARRLAGAHAGDAEGAPGRHRLGAPPEPGSLRVEPVVLRLPGGPASEDRLEARRELLARIEAGGPPGADMLRLEPHEHATLRERAARGRNAPGAGDEVAWDALPEALSTDEAYVAYHPMAARVEGTAEAIDWGSPVDLPEDPVGAAASPWPEPPAGAGPARGDPPVIGVIDDGIAFLNARFRRPGGTRTRFDAVWLQAFRTLRAWPEGLPRPPTRPYEPRTWLGTVLTGPQIDWFARHGPGEDAVYRHLSRALHEPGQHRSLEHAFTHGTHVCDLAAGADPESADPATRWPILGVGLPPEAVDHTAGTYIELLAVLGVRWILRRARRLGRGPVIVNISFGALAGPKDGTKPVEWLLAQELARFEAQTGRCARLVWSFGNARRNRQVARIEPGAEPAALQWRLKPDDRAASYLEIRPDGGRLEGLTVEVAAPGGGVWRVPAPGPGRVAVLRADGRAALALYRPTLAGPLGGPEPLPFLVLAAGPTVLEPGAPADRPRAASGAYGLTLRWRGSPAGARIEVQRGDTPIGYRANGRQSTLDHPCAHAREAATAAWTDPRESPITRAGTHSSYVTARSSDGPGPCDRMLSVGAATPGSSPDVPRPATYSAAGAPWSVPGPTLSVPAERGVARRGILGSGTLSGSARASGGTSAAAPRAARALATLLEEEGCGPGTSRRHLACALVARGGTPTDPGREALPEGHADRLRPGDAARLGLGTLAPDTGRRQG